MLGGIVIDDSNKFKGVLTPTTHTNNFMSTGELDISALAAALGPLPQTPLREGLAAVLTPLV